MNKELIVNVAPKEISIALLEDKQLVELNKEQCKTGFSVGDIYLGKVRKIMPGLNAAFVSIGYDKDAFIHYLDLGSHFHSYSKLTEQVLGPKSKKPFRFEQLRTPNKPIEKVGKISSVLKTGDMIMVQIAKEAISTKGPRLTADISLAGRHSVLVPFGGKISISQKVRSTEEKKRLRQIVHGVLPSNYGVIVRTAAVGKAQADIENDIKSLIQKWENAIETMRTETAPCLLLSELNRTNAILRDLLNGSFSNVHIDDQTIYEQIREYIKTIAPEKEKIVKLYKGNVPIFENFDIAKQIKSLFSTYVSLRKGAYLIMEQTEAMHVVDVNSGNRAKVDDNQERTAMEVNIAAATELARQLRLRDMGGIIVVDFIDLATNENRVALYQKMNELMSTDRARHTILPLTKFGLMQITRQRVRPATKIDISETCPMCNGTGTIQPTILIADQIENRIAYFAEDRGLSFIEMRVSPIVAHFLKCRLIPASWKWFFKHGCRVKVVADTSIGVIETKYFDKHKIELI
ncbi:MAG: Rne/Rng family ribonuclease [Rikenellaceae bacterium]